jgi:hypothetical protein
VPTTTADIDQSPRHSGRRVVAQAVLSSCLVLATLTGPVAWFFYVELHFFGESADVADYQGALTVCVVTALLLLAGEVAVLGLRSPWGQHALVVAAVLVQVYVAGRAYAGATGTPDRDVISPAGFSLSESVTAGLLIPTSWPLELLLLTLLVGWVVRAPSRPAPR